MSELLVELFSEEIPPNLQVSARTQLKKIFSDELSSINLPYKDISVFSSPTRLVILISGLLEKIKIPPSEVKGPKLGVPKKIIENFARSKNVNINSLIEKKIRKRNFLFC